MSSMSRTPAGVPTGGQWATTEHSECSLDLSDTDERTFEEKVADGVDTVTAEVRKQVPDALSYTLRPERFDDGYAYSQTVLVLRLTGEQVDVDLRGDSNFSSLATDAATELSDLEQPAGSWADRTVQMPADQEDPR